jgi:hypothetical protein
MLAAGPYLGHESDKLSAPAFCLPNGIVTNQDLNLSRLLPGSSQSCCINNLYPQKQAPPNERHDILALSLSGAVRFLVLLQTVALKRARRSPKQNYNDHKASGCSLA